MAAAALGNTLSDVLGIGSAWYVENIAAKIGVRPPPLSPIQLDMKSSRIFANVVRYYLLLCVCVHELYKNNLMYKLNFKASRFVLF